MGSPVRDSNVERRYFLLFSEDSMHMPIQQYDVKNHFHKSNGESVSNTGVLFCVSLLFFFAIFTPVLLGAEESELAKARFQYSQNLQLYALASDDFDSLQRYPSANSLQTVNDVEKANSEVERVLALNIYMRLLKKYVQETEDDEGVNALPDAKTLSPDRLKACNNYLTDRIQTGRRINSADKILTEIFESGVSNSEKNAESDDVRQKRQNTLEKIKLVDSLVKTRRQSVENLKSAASNKSMNFIQKYTDATTQSLSIWLEINREETDNILSSLNSRNIDSYDNNLEAQERQSSLKLYQQTSPYYDSVVKVVQDYEKSLQEYAKSLAEYETSVQKYQNAVQEYRSNTNTTNGTPEESGQCLALYNNIYNTIKNKKIRDPNVSAENFDLDRFNSLLNALVSRKSTLDRAREALDSGYQDLNRQYARASGAENNDNNSAPRIGSVGLDRANNNAADFEKTIKDRMEEIERGSREADRRWEEDRKHFARIDYERAVQDGLKVGYTEGFARAWLPNPDETPMDEWNEKWSKAQGDWYDMIRRKENNIWLEKELNQ